MTNQRGSGKTAGSLGAGGGGWDRGYGGRGRVQVGNKLKKIYRKRVEVGGCFTSYGKRGAQKTSDFKHLFLFFFINILLNPVLQIFH